jgi:hypothetical protein
MFKSNKYKILDYKHENNTPLLSSNSRGEKHKLRIKNIKERVRLKKIKDINGMEISYNVIKKKN